jgi:hypothetical protein
MTKTLLTLLVQRSLFSIDYDEQRNSKSETITLLQQFHKDLVSIISCSFVCVETIVVAIG